MAPTRPATPRCCKPGGPFPIGSGPSRAAAASANTSPTAWSTTARPSWTYPPTLRQVRVFAVGNGRKTDPVDAHSVALVALRTPALAENLIHAGQTPHTMTSTPSTHGLA